MPGEKVELIITCIGLHVYCVFRIIHMFVYFNFLVVCFWMSDQATQQLYASSLSKAYSLSIIEKVN